VWPEARRTPPANIAGADAFPGVAPVKSFREDRGPYGHFDLAGNVAEWTSTTSSGGGFKNLRISAGGRWDAPAEAGYHEVFWANHLPPRRFDFALGFRCVERYSVE
jgi:formylglycine-generating enzyme required for sulfatase activity